MNSSQTDDEDVPEFPLSRFMDVFTNLPKEEREKSVVVIDGEPINWHMARREIENETGLGRKIGKKLVNMDII